MIRLAPARVRAAAVVVLLGAILAACDLQAAHVGAEHREQDSRLVITGSSTVAPLVAEIARRYESAHTGVRVDVQSGGSSRGIEDVRQGLADLGMVSRDLRDDEADLVASAIARDGVAVVVHAANPACPPEDGDVARIYHGSIRDWSEIGGPAGVITVVHKAAGRATLEVFLAHFGLHPRDVRADVIIGDNEQGIKTIAGNPGAIGYVSIGAGEASIGAGVAIRLCPVGGVAATSETLESGRFPLVRPLNLVTAGSPGDAQRSFIAFARSPAVHDLVRKLSFAPAVDR